ncbi:MAG: hypothetical protein WCO56_29130 [Verrucomicrobiota bacterium]
MGKINKKGEKFEGKWGGTDMADKQMRISECGVNLQKNGETPTWQKD